MPSWQGDFWIQCSPNTSTASTMIIRAGVNIRSRVRGEAACSPTGPPSTSDRPRTTTSSWLGLTSSGDGSVISCVCGAAIPLDPAVPRPAARTGATGVDGQFPLPGPALPLGLGDGELLGGRVVVV